LRSAPGHAGSKPARPGGLRAQPQARLATEAEMPVYLSIAFNATFRLIP
jgi:hypothetical protein